MSLFSDPVKNIEAAGITPGMIVADFGAGAGQYVFAAAHALAATGRVYAIDVKKDTLDKIAKDARDQNLSNIDVLYGDLTRPEGSQLAEHCVDLVILSNILFQVTDKSAVLGEAKRVLKSGGRVLIIDWKDSLDGTGPAHAIPQSEMTGLFEKNGFAKDREFAAGSHHYGMIFKKL